MDGDDLKFKDVYKLCSFFRNLVFELHLSNTLSYVQTTQFIDICEFQIVLRLSKTMTLTKKQFY